MPIRFKQKARAFEAPKIIKAPPRWKLWVQVVVLLLIGLAAAVFDFSDSWNQMVGFIGSKTPIQLPEWHSRPFRLGLDLLGGSELIYEADLSQVSASGQSDAVNGVRDVIERRVNAMGVSEPVVQTVRSGNVYRVIVQLAGIRDINEAIRSIGETPVLEFKEESAQNPTAQAELEAVREEAQNKVDEITNKLKANPRIDFDRLAREVDLTVEDLGFIKKSSNPELWQWADTHRVEEQTADPIETSRGWYFIKTTGEREGSEQEVEASHILICYQGATGCTQEISKEDARKKAEELKAQVNSSNFADLAKANSTEEAARTNGGSLGWFGRGQMIKPFEDAVFGMRTGDISDIIETDFGFHMIYKTGERTLREYSVRQIFVAQPADLDVNQAWVNTGLSGKHLVRARMEFDQNTGDPIVALTFNDDGKNLFGEITARNVGKRVAIFLDGAPISAPTVQTEIRDGNAIITNIGSISEAKLLAQRLNAGALPVPIHLISQQTVGATLGQNSLQKSLFAGLIGFALVALFMLLYYRVPGLVSVIALGIYTVLVLAIFKLIPVTLTLAGLAGFVLSLGMAVDANVLIFERVKEELLAGHSLGSAIEEGAHRAWFSIRDGHFTTLLSALVLFWFSSSLIKGFALTLGIGVLLSLFSALTVSQTMLRLVAGWRWRKRVGLFKPYTRAKIITKP